MDSYNQRGMERREILSRATADGKETTEYQAGQSGSFWGIVATILGIIIIIGGIVASALGESSAWGIAAGMAVTVAGQLQKALIDYGYIKARQETKTATINAMMSEAVAAASEAKLELASITAANAAASTVVKPASPQRVDAEPPAAGEFDLLSQV